MSFWKKALTIAAVVLGGSALAGLSDRNVDYVRTADAAPMMDCHDCDSCSWPYSTCHHKVSLGTAVGGPNHGCQDVQCDPCPHPSCNATMTRDSITHVAAVVAAGDAKALEKILRNPLVTFNHERRSLQIEGCADNIIANLPLSPSLVAALQ